MLTRKEFTLVLVTAVATAAAVSLAQPQPAKRVMGQSAFEWQTLEARPTATGFTRKVFQSPTGTLDELECHVTTVNAGAASHAPHQHPEEELMIIKEGTVEALMNGEWKKFGPGSIVFQAPNILHGLRNAGDTPATYYVLKWRSPGMAPKPAANP